MNNVNLKDGFTQVCVWEGTVVGTERVEDFEKFMLDETGVRIQYLEEIVTTPDIKDGHEVPDTGGRNDVFFAVHKEDTSKFALTRLQYGIRWVEDVLSAVNYKSEIYPSRVSAYKSW